jgi:dihydrofolate reductase
VTRARAELVLVAAVARTGVIGVDGGLPWHLPDDLRRFRAITSGHPVVMGRRTFESVGRALPRRTNVVITGTPGYDAPGCTIAPDLDAALEVAHRSPGGHTVFVIGGGVLYADAMNLADRLEITHVELDIEGDTWFPAIDPQRWEVVASERHDPDRDHEVGFEFRTYRRT